MRTRILSIVIVAAVGCLVASCKDLESAPENEYSLSPYTYYETSCTTDADCTIAAAVKDCSMCCTQGVRALRDTERLRADYERVREVCNSSRPSGTTGPEDAGADEAGVQAASLQEAIAPRGFSICTARCSFTAACRDGQCATVACDGPGCGQTAGASGAARQ